ncbi:aminopeptidase N [Leptothrix cholodnii SP-6]|uniref:Aminopeptidase N n=1 Tax=Leptothrix cholodnii (strain ATCC 51168 / LMG 8142 / SP-6) TaxID=395495 RepID=B1XZ12_LEPCP|nr:aminopeptidase N [Leptothrix cholodnii]ACB34031.1 aminopeptidase N [Leptothrix cholodnii SP-6]
MREGTSTVVRREDYTAPSHWIRTVDLTFDLDPAKTLVISRMSVEPNTERPGQPLRLDGEDITLTRVLVNGESISFRFEGQQLVLEHLPAEPFSLEIRNTCAPEKNTELSGLYTSGGSFFTQCEAQGFRRITYFLDRPDVMALYTVTLRANAKAYPVLLSNGNRVEHGTLDNGRHFATWVDPHPKPSYLFALVAGALVCREQCVRSRSGKDHLLQVYVRAGDLDKTEHAMNSLIASVVWDEARFGLSLDLERFMIVAVSDFNMGAMENKGLNIFNTKFVLANPATATDTDYANIEAVVGHEYFHNWTGNRVTCRDWFQLSLKEGLTVYRDQEFSQDMAGVASARAVKRIEDVRQLRQMQFPEDAGPMAHPVRPEQYQAIDNFYTTTVYEKGAEVVRMMATLVGREGFRRGMDLYFARHDGQAVTCDDFAQAIADANPGSDLATRLDSFKRWYSQAGTPRVSASGHYDPGAGTYTVTLAQHTPATPGQPVKLPFVIPVAMGLLDSDGRPLLLQLQGESQYGGTERVLVLEQANQAFVFTGLYGLTGEPVPSLLRGFSAPVILEWAATERQLFTLLHHDTDPTNRWEAAQRLGLLRLMGAVQSGRPLQLDAAYIDAQRAVLRDPSLDAAFKDLLLTPPSEGYVAEQLAAAGVPVDPPAIHAAREAMRSQLAQALFDDWVWAFEAHHDNGAYRPDPVSTGRRALANLALAHLVLDAGRSGDPVWPGRAYQRVQDAGNFTDRQGALIALLGAHHALAELALARVHAQFKHEALVIDRWFALQAGAPERDGQVFQRIKTLVHHPDFLVRNPNRARSVLTTLFHLNPSALHRADAAGYVFWAEKVVEVDAFNPQLAARLARGLDRWRVLAEPYRSAAHEALCRVAARTELSPDTREIVGRSLAD